MLRDLIKQDADNQELVELGQIANKYAEQNAFNNYRADKSKNTIRRQDAELDLFQEYLLTRGVAVVGLNTDPYAWKGVTWGLVSTYIDWLLGEGYAVSGINTKLSTIKTYAKLAFKAGVLTAAEYALIQTVEGYSRQGANNLDTKRDTTRRPTAKKADPTELDDTQAAALKHQPNTPIGRRDALLMCLLLDHGLRVSEVELLEVNNFNLDAGTFTFKRPKTTDKLTHLLTSDTLRAVKTYLLHDADPEGVILKGANKNGKLTRTFKLRAITKRVRDLGQSIGIPNLSPHDCRHYLATKLADTKTMRELMDVFGWSSPYMAIRYIKAAEIADPN